jgi:pimeloyl-ACP methyl ester carboxylesterase
MFWLFLFLILSADMKTTINVFLLCLVLYATQMTAQQSMIGTFTGRLEVQGTEIELIFEFLVDSADQTQKCLLSIAKQGLRAHAADEVVQTDTNFTVVFSPFSAQYIGVLDTEGKILGTWKQGGYTAELNLEQTEDAPLLNRPQEPKPPFPYEMMDLMIKNQASPGVELAGTLTTPKGEGPFPLVVFISGSGPQNRNSELFGHKPFWVIADYLTRHGIAVFRYDERGIGASKGDFQAATTVDLASDTRAIVEYLEKQDLPISRIGLIGHSEGGIIAPIVANESSAVQFIVLLAAPGVTGQEILLAQSALILEKAGTPQEEIARQVQFAESLYDLVLNTPMEEELDYEQLKEISLLFYDQAGKELKEQYDTFERFYFTQSSVLSSKWMRFFIGYDPQPALQKLNIPVFALNGSLDLQVPVKENLQAIQRALELAPTIEFELKEVPGLNHLFQSAETGHPNEYAEIEETFNESVLQMVATWVLSLNGH